MARYRKIEVRIWNDEKFRAMSDRGKLAFLFLLTHPHMTGLGAMRGTLAGLAAELGWTEKGFREAFREPLSKGMAKHDEATCFIGIPNFIRHNPPENPNVVKSWRDQLDLIPEGRMKDELLQQVKAFVEGLGEGFAKALPKPFAKGMANQEQEQEQEQEHKQEQDNLGGKPPASPRFVPPTIDDVAAYCAERANRIDPEAFVAHYAKQGWVQSNGRKLTDWKAAVITWEKNDRKRAGNSGGPDLLAGLRESRERRIEHDGR